MLIAVLSEKDSVKCMPETVSKKDIGSIGTLDIISLLNSISTTTILKGLYTKAPTRLDRSSIDCESTRRRCLKHYTILPLLGVLSCKALENKNVEKKAARPK